MAIISPKNYEVWQRDDNGMATVEFIYNPDSNESEWFFTVFNRPVNDLPFITPKDILFQLVLDRSNFRDGTNIKFTAVLPSGGWYLLSIGSNRNMDIKKEILFGVGEVFAIYGQ